MSFVLYGDVGSGSCIVEGALSAIGLEFETRDLDLGKGEQREPAYAAVNPQRKLPALITPRGEIWTESAAIVLALDERYPEAALLPPVRTSERAQALRWLLYVASEIYPLVEINDYPERFAAEPASAEALRERTRQHWRERWLRVEAAVAGDPWLLASGFCVADLYIAVVSRWAQQSSWRPSHVPRVEAIARAVASHPPLDGVWRRHFGSR